MRNTTYPPQLKVVKIAFPLVLTADNDARCAGFNWMGNSGKGMNTMRK